MAAASRCCASAIEYAENNNGIYWCAEKFDGDGFGGGGIVPSR